MNFPYPLNNRVFNRKLLALAFPITLQNLMLALVAAADAVMLGRVSQNAMAAVSLATQIQFVQNMLLGAIVCGVGILGAQYWGRKDVKMLEKIFGLSIHESLLVSIAFGTGQNRRGISAGRQLVLPAHRHLPVLSGHHARQRTRLPFGLDQFRRGRFEHRFEFDLHLRPLRRSGDGGRRSGAGDGSRPDHRTRLVHRLQLRKKLHFPETQSGHHLQQTALPRLLALYAPGARQLPALGNRLHLIHGDHGPHGSGCRRRQRRRRSGARHHVLPLQRHRRRPPEPGF